MKALIRPRVGIIIVIMILAFSFEAAAQEEVRDHNGPRTGFGNGRLTGTVKDDAGNPIPGAKIVLRYLGDDKVTFEAKTDQAGEWRFLGLGSGEWKITAFADGHSPAEVTRTVSQLVRNPPVPLALIRVQTSIQNPTMENLQDKASELFYLEKYGEAAAALLDYLRLDPQDVMARLWAGDCFRENGEFQKSIEQFGIVVEMTSNDPLSKEILARGLTGLGECYFKLGDLEKAESHFRSSLEKAPDNEVVAYNLGEVCFSLGKNDDAIRYYDQAARLAPAWADPLFKLGLACLKAGQNAKAGEAWRKFLALESSSPRAVQVKKDLTTIK